MSINLFQSHLFVGGAFPSVTVNYPAATNATDFLVMGFQTQNPAGVITVSDNVNGNWNQDFVATGSIWQAGFFSFPNSQSGNIQVTYNQTGNPGFTYIILEEWTGIIQSNPFDQSSAHSAASSTPDSGTTGPISQVPELVLGLMAVGAVNHMTPGSGYILDVENGALGMEYQVVNSGSNPQLATFNLVTSQTYLALVATYRGVGQAGPTPRQYYVLP